MAAYVSPPFGMATVRESPSKPIDFSNWQRAEKQ